MATLMIYDKNRADLGHAFSFMGDTLEGKLNQSVSETRDPNLYGSYHRSMKYNKINEDPLNETKGIINY